MISAVLLGLGELSDEATIWVLKLVFAYLPMHPMNNPVTRLLIATCATALITVGAGAESLRWSHPMTKAEGYCLTGLMESSKFSTIPQAERRELVGAARVARADLKGVLQKAYVYLFDDNGWCGSAGCALLIGEQEAGGACHLLYSGHGWYTARALRRRDHGFRRMYLPCEVRFDGKQYQQLRDECPNVNVQH